MRRRIIVGGMVLGLLLGCNNGVAELEKRNQFLNSVVNLGNDFLNVFTSFGEMFSFFNSAYVILKTNKQFMIDVLFKKSI